MGRKLFLAFMLLVMMVGSTTGVHAAEQNDTSRLALDMVIALDMSSSMAKNEKQSNDMDGYRLDAAAIMLGLCDAEHSRAAIVPFAGKVLEDDFHSTKHFNKLYEINMLKNASTRASMIKELNDDEMRRRGNADTGLGEALTRAVELLMENPSSNRPVIVLMTDGKIDFSSNKATNRKNSEASQEAYEKARQLAIEHNIPIYTVGLKGHGSFDGELLEQTALSTGGLYHEITRASDLPEVFNSLYANEVGSNVVDLHAEMQDSENGMLSAVLKVPNRSIAEANILVPIGTSNGSAVKLYKPNDSKPVGFDGKSIIAYKTKFFTLLKILKPQEVGEWRIEFDEKDVDAANVNIHVVFSYDVVPDFEFSAEKAEKQRDLTAFVKFHEPNGEYTSDEHLYIGGIQASLDLSDKDGNILARSLPMEKTESAFTYTFKPGELISNVSSGTYYFTASLKGDGMDLVSEPGEITIINLPPEKTNEGENPFEKVTIHDPTSEDYTKEFSAEINLNSYMVDPDKEKLTFELLNAQELNFMNVGSIREDGVIKLSTKNMSGNAIMKIAASDTDPQKATTEFEIPIAVRNVRDEVGNNYSLVITVDEDQVGKVSDYHYTAKLMDGQKWVKDEKWLNLVQDSDLRVKKTYAEGKGEPKEESLLFVVGEDAALHATYKTELHECTYEVVGEARVRDIPIQLDASKANIELKNNPPEMSGKGENPFASVAIHDPATENYTNEYEDTLDLSAYIHEPDGEKVTYEAEVTEGGDVVEITKLDKNSGQLTLKTRNKTGEAKLTVTATDEEGAPISWSIPVSVKNVSAEIQNLWKIEANWPETMEKGQEYICEVKAAYDINPTSGDANQIAKLIDMSGVQLKKTYDEENIQIVPLEWKLNETEDGVQATFHTDDVSCTYQLEGNACIRDIIVPLSCEPIQVGNIPPAVSEEAVAELQNTFLIEPLLWENANEDKYTLMLGSLFEDTPGDKLDYSVRVVELGDKGTMMDEASILKGVDEGSIPSTVLDVVNTANGTAVITNTIPGDRVLLLTATDRDHEEARILYTSTIISQKARVIRLILQVLAAIVALIILIELFYWLGYRKPWTRMHGNVTMTVNGVPHSNSVGFPRRGRGDVTLNAIRITNAAAGPGELMNTLNNLGKTIKLRAGAKGKVKVMRAGKLNKAVKINVDGRNLSGNTKQLIWNPNGKMSISMNLSNNEINIEMKRVAPASDKTPKAVTKSTGSGKGTPAL